MAIVQKGLTLEEFLALPEQKPALEYEKGVVIRKVSPKKRHSRLQTGLAKLFDRFGEPERLYATFTELRTAYGGRSYVPDLCVYGWERVAVDDNGEVVDGVATDPPDVAVEIVSPEQSVNFLVRKCLWYLQNGAKAALLVDPADESVLLFWPGQPGLALSGEEEIDLAQVLPGFRVSVSDLFSALRFR